MLDNLAAAILAAAALPVATLRDLEANWRWAAVHDHWSPALDDVTGAGADLLARADAVDHFLARAYVAECIRVLKRA